MINKITRVLIKIIGWKLLTIQVVIKIQFKNLSYHILVLKSIWGYLCSAIYIPMSPLSLIDKLIFVKEPELPKEREPVPETDILEEQIFDEQIIDNSLSSGING